MKQSQRYKNQKVKKHLAAASADVRPRSDVWNVQNKSQSLFTGDTRIQDKRFSARHLDALNAPEKHPKKYSIHPTGWESNARSSMRNRTGRWDPRGEKNNEKTRLWHTYLTPTRRFQSWTYFCVASQPKYERLLAFYQAQRYADTITGD